MHDDRRTALLAGLAYLLTFAASIPALALIGPALVAGYVIGPGADAQVTTGALLDLANAGACVATAVVLLPVVRRHGARLALGFVTSRLLEAAIIATGVVSLLAVVSLRQGPPAGVDAAVLTTVGAALVAVRGWTFLLGPGLMAGINALLLGTLMYRSGLVPRWIPLLGLVGAPLHLASVIATFYGLHSQVSVTAALAALPVAAWELSLGLWLTVRGFRVPSPAAGAATAEAHLA